MDKNKKNGRYEEEDGIYWYKDGQKHRIDGPAVEHSNGTKEWWMNGMKHREDGPAVEFSDGGKEWWLDGNRHREDGPAIEDSDGDKKWYLNDVEYTEEEFNHWRSKKDLNEKLHITLEQKTITKRLKL